MTVQPQTLNADLQKALEIDAQIEALNKRRLQLIRSRAIYLREAVEHSGLNPREIGEHFNVGRQRVYQMVEQGGLTMPKLR